MKKWAELNEGKTIAEESKVQLCFMMPPIARMDPGLKDLAHVEYLSLSTNCIDRISNLNGFSKSSPAGVLVLALAPLLAVAGLCQVKAAAGGGGGGGGGGGEWKDRRQSSEGPLNGPKPPSQRPRARP